ncbi:DUF4149 domain-containing protein [Pseudomonas sp.]|jgi:hypothetical protein|uniref:DUF4149 domain-containing protein n=1 Tax=Pseudomonas sp. TaxID=306 RepID=UPI0037C9DB9E
MRSLRFVISKPAGRDAGSISWLLAQALWVGGLWLLHFLLLPAIAHAGLASLLVEEISNALRPLLMGLAAFCAGLQVFVLVHAKGLSSLWRDTRGQLLIAVEMMAGSYFVVRQLVATADLWLMFSYLAVAFCGLLLVLQPVPVRARDEV